ncbi:MAG: hypothetical protein J3R72DRAFT_438267 [Linnemannia gamsii]|nr:MAG: hypothetical protein J3R72DRAFT_438267 [Linnemannia gamsii]
MSHTLGSLGSSGIRTAGGIGGAKPINKDHPLDPEVHKILVHFNDHIRASYVKMSAADSMLTFEPVSYASQVVAGTNHYVKLRVNQEGGRDHAEYIHVKIFDQPWTNTLEFTGFDVGKTLDEQFQYEMPAPPK